LLVSREAVKRISELLIPGSFPPGLRRAPRRQTGRFTEFIVLAH